MSIDHLYRSQALNETATNSRFFSLQYNTVGLCFLCVCVCVCVQPHTWLRNGDTHLQLAHFKKDRRKRDEPDISEHIMKGLP